MTYAGAQYQNRRRRAIIFRSGGVVLWRGRSIPHQTTLSCGGKGGAAGGGRANIRTFKEAFPPQWLVGVDRLRCKWLNLKSATLMFFKSTQGHKGNLLIPITGPLRLLPVTESVALPP